MIGAATKKGWSFDRRRLCLIEGVTGAQVDRLPPQFVAEEWLRQAFPLQLHNAVVRNEEHATLASQLHTYSEPFRNSLLFLRYLDLNSRLNRSQTMA